jgi:pimeloyl-ACP methyl ester carboxylesterase
VSALGAAIELAWVGARLVGYPLGVVHERRRHVGDRYRTDDLTPVQRGLLRGDVEAAGTPILLVHGMVDNRSVFAVLRRSLHRRGFGRVVTMNYPLLTSDVASAAALLGEQVERLCAETGYERIHVVGHSLGGLLARWYVQKLGGDALVHTVVTLGTPHTGTAAAKLLPLRVTRQMRPESPVVRALAEPAPGCRTRFVAFASDLDEMMVPRRCAELAHPDLRVRNVRLRGIGHLALPGHPKVAHEIAATLAHLDHDGEVVVAGVSPLPPPSSATTTAQRRGGTSAVNAAGRGR